ncbi:MAG: hypothetical protein QXX82_03740 [Nitrososphaerota archaeon]
MAAGRRLALVIAILLLLLTGVSVLAVALSVTAKGVAGSDKVDVSCPVDGCAVTVGWVLDSDYENVDKCRIEWTPIQGKTVSIACIVYDSGGNLLSKGIATGQTSSPTVVDLDPNVDPKDIYKVKVVIVEE